MWVSCGLRSVFKTLHITHETLHKKYERSEYLQYMNRRLRIGIIGCGVITQWAHIPALFSKDLEIPYDGKYYPDFNNFIPYPRNRKYCIRPQLQAICDLNQQNLKRVAHQTNIYRVYTDMHKMLSEEKLDAVLLACFYTDNAKLIPQIAKYKVHILVEKPLARTLQEGIQIKKSVQENNIILHVGFMRRYSYAYRLMKQMLETRQYGELKSLSMNFWAGNIESFHENGIHAFDIFQYMGGRVKRVYAENNNISTHITVRFDNGVIGSMAMTDAPLLHQITNERMVATTSEGVQLIAEGGRRLFISKKGSPCELLEPCEFVHYYPATSIRGFSEEWRTFLHAIATGEKCGCDIDEGLKSLRFKESVIKSIKYGKPVEC